MSLITHILICEPQEIGEPRGSGLWAPNVPRLDYNGVDNVLLATLWRTLNEKESGDSLAGIEFVVWAKSTPLVFRLPDDLTHRLSALSTDEIGPTAQRWAADRDAQLEGLTRDGAEKGLSELVLFAKSAVAQRRPLVLAMYF
jgi:hypothetical protein